MQFRDSEHKARFNNLENYHKEELDYERLSAKKSDNIRGMARPKYAAIYLAALETCEYPQDYSIETIVDSMQGKTDVLSRVVCSLFDENKFDNISAKDLICCEYAPFYAYALSLAYPCYLGTNPRNAGIKKDLKNETVSKIIEMKDMQHLSFKEIATKLEMTESNVKYNYYKAKRDMARDKDSEKRNYIY